MEKYILLVIPEINEFKFIFVISSKELALSCEEHTFAAYKRRWWKFFHFVVINETVLIFIIIGVVTGFFWLGVLNIHPIGFSIESKLKETKISQHVNEILPWKQQEAVLNNENLRSYNANI